MVLLYMLLIAEFLWFQLDLYLKYAFFSKHQEIHRMEIKYFTFVILFAVLTAILFEGLCICTYINYLDFPIRKDNQYKEI